VTKEEKAGILKRLIEEMKMAGDGETALDALLTKLDARLIDLFSLNPSKQRLFRAQLKELSKLAPAEIAHRLPGLFQTIMENLDEDPRHSTLQQILHSRTIVATLITTLGVILVALIPHIVGQFTEKQTKTNYVATVKDESGELITDADVILEMNGIQIPLISTGSDGRFRYRDIPVGSGHIKITASNYTPYEHDIMVPDRTEFVLRRTLQDGNPPQLPQRQRHNLMENPSFEELGALELPDQWDTKSWGHGSVFHVDSTIVKSGTRSIRIDSLTTPDHAKWAQIRHVKSNAGYRLTAWVRTENVAHSSESRDFGANIAVLGVTNGPSIIADPVGIFGTNDWTPVALSFTTGSETLVEVACQIGTISGTTTGSAWFDDIELTEVP